MTTETFTADEIVFDEPEAGIYPATFEGIETFSYEDKQTGETETRWRWAWMGLSGTPFDTLTSRSFKPGTNALKLFAGILGRAPQSGDKPNDHIGELHQLVYGPNRNGTLTVTGVHRDKAKA
jgi:hypothetical protein